MAKHIMQLWHPDSPGMKVWVMRGWWARKFFPKGIATLWECQEYKAFNEHMMFHVEILGLVGKKDPDGPLVYKRNASGVVIT